MAGCSLRADCGMLGFHDRCDRAFLVVFEAAAPSSWVAIRQRPRPIILALRSVSPPLASNLDARGHRRPSCERGSSGARHRLRGDRCASFGPAGTRSRPPPSTVFIGKTQSTDGRGTDIAGTPSREFSCPVGFRIPTSTRRPWAEPRWGVARDRRQPRVPHQSAPESAVASWSMGCRFHGTDASGGRPYLPATATLWDLGVAGV